MPVYPGTEPPEITPACTIASHGFCETKLSFYSHTGTHIDAPRHLLKDGKSLDQFPLDYFYNTACIIRLPKYQHAPIACSDLYAFEPRIRSSKIILICTGWSSYWNSPAYFRDYPLLSIEAAHWLSQFSLYAIGVDAISVDAIDAETLQIHDCFLRKNILIIENLTNLSSIDQPSFTLSMFPLKTAQADGLSTRVVAIL